MESSCQLMAITTVSAARNDMKKTRALPKESGFFTPFSSRADTKAFLLKKIPTADTINNIIESIVGIVPFLSAFLVATYFKICTAKFNKIIYNIINNLSII